MSISRMESSGNKVRTKSGYHMLNNCWTLWAHLPTVSDWSLKSYIPIMDIDSVEKLLSLNGIIEDKVITNCMLFLMKNKIKPLWEDPRNKQGGSISFKVSNSDVVAVWKKLSMLVCGETISTCDGFINDITGLTISPKKSFCIIKIWMAVSDYQDPDMIVDIPNLTKHGCLFKTHQPEF